MGVPLDQIVQRAEDLPRLASTSTTSTSARAYRVYVQAGAAFRDQPRDIGELYVRSQTGALISLDNLVHVKTTAGPPVISHYNLFRSTELNGSPTPGTSSRRGHRRHGDRGTQSPAGGFGFEWSGISREELHTAGSQLIIFALGLLFVFLVLAAQYESFALPLIVLLAVPLALLGALAAQRVRGLHNDVFCQIGLLMLIGLASKNAILIVEFAEQLRNKGADAVDAVQQAALLRLRPILMTSLAFLLGILPLVFATGSGANSRRSMGTALFGGLLLSTVLNLFFTPALYLMMERAREHASARRRTVRQPQPG